MENISEKINELRKLTSPDFFWNIINHGTHEDYMNFVDLAGNNIINYFQETYLFNGWHERKKAIFEPETEKTAFQILVERGMDDTAIEMLKMIDYREKSSSDKEKVQFKPFKDGVWRDWYKIINPVSVAIKNSSQKVLAHMHDLGYGIASEDLIYSIKNSDPDFFNEVFKGRHINENHFTGSLMGDSKEKTTCEKVFTILVENPEDERSRKRIKKLLKGKESKILNTRMLIFMLESPDRAELAKQFLKTIDCTKECFEQFHTKEIFNAVSYLLKEKKHNSLSRLIEYGFPLDFKNKDGLNIKEMIEQAVPNANKIVILNKIIEEVIVNVERKELGDMFNNTKLISKNRL